MNLTLEDTEKNLGLITSNNIEFPFTNIISDNYDFSNNSSIKKDNIFLHVNDEKSFAAKAEEYERKKALNAKLFIQDAYGRK